jgi:hypothetical protein
VIPFIHLSLVIVLKKSCSGFIMLMTIFDKKTSGVLVIPFIHLSLVIVLKQVLLGLYYVDDQI